MRKKNVVSEAQLTDDGIRITGVKSMSSRQGPARLYRPSTMNMNVGPRGSGSGPTSGSGIDRRASSTESFASLTSFSSMNSHGSLSRSRSGSSVFETASLVSCVTCLSDSSCTDSSMSSVSVTSSGGTISTSRRGNNNGKKKGKKAGHRENSMFLPINTVIPYARVLNARCYMPDFNKDESSSSLFSQSSEQFLPSASSASPTPRPPRKSFKRSSRRLSNVANTHADDIDDETDAAEEADPFINTRDSTLIRGESNTSQNQVLSGLNPFINGAAADGDTSLMSLKKQKNDNVVVTEECIESPPSETASMNRSPYYKHDLKLIEVTFAKPRRQDVVPKKILLSIDSNMSADDLVEEIMKRSYKNTKQSRSILVIINPFGGKGKAKKLFNSKAKPLLSASRCFLDIKYTKYPEHAIDIARELDINKYDTIACASGDGIPFEVINGLYRRPDRVEAFQKLAVTQLPCGSGNAMSVSCNWTNNPSYAALCLLKSVEARIDLMCCSQPSYVDEFPRLSFLSQTYGVIAESDINTEFIRWMGPARFELGVAFNVLQRKKYPCDLYVKYAAKTKNDLKVHYLEHKDKGALTFEGELPGANSGSNACDDNCTTSSGNADETITEENFILKYPLKDGIPDDWERLDPSISDNVGIFYTGKMPYIAADTKFFPAALPCDGTIDMVITDARTSVTRMAPILLALDKGSHVLQPEVIHSKILAYKLIPKLNHGLFSVDGEKFPLEPLQVEVLPKLCKTLLRNGSYVDTAFDSM